MIFDIILIGPMRTGKSTLAKLLAKRLSLPQASIDDKGMAYYRKAGLDWACFHEIRRVQGELAAYQYFERFLPAAVEWHLEGNRGSVIDLGAGHTVYWAPSDAQRVADTLSPYANVVLVLPSADLEESAAVLRKRTRKIAWLDAIRKQEGFDLNERFLRHEANFRLARHTVYTQRKSPKEACSDLLDRVAVQPGE